MIFLHDSLNDKAFERDKKLQLLKNGIISISQFVNLIEPNDDYLVIGPAVVAKSKIKDFIQEWRTRDLNLENAVNSQSIMTITQDEFIAKLDDLMKVFPEIVAHTTEFRKQLSLSSCPKCVKNHYLSIIASIIKKYMDDGRDISSIKDFLNLLIAKYYPLKKNYSDLMTDFDVEWLKPESLIGLGKDLIDNLDNCFDCTLKHLSRAKILHEEFLTGYPDHKKLMFNELTEGNKDLEQAYLIYMDSIAQLDMASCELVGDMSKLPEEWGIEMIELANEIRNARLLFQDDPTRAPDFDALRIAVKRLQIKTNKAVKAKS